MARKRSAPTKLFFYEIESCAPGSLAPECLAVIVAAPNKKRAAEVIAGEARRRQKEGWKLRATYFRASVTLRRGGAQIAFFL